MNHPGARTQKRPSSRILVPVQTDTQSINTSPRPRASDHSAAKLVHHHPLKPTIDEATQGTAPTWLSQPKDFSNSASILLVKPPPKGKNTHQVQHRQSSNRSLLSSPSSSTTVISLRQSAVIANLWSSHSSLPLNQPKPLPPTTSHRRASCRGGGADSSDMRSYKSRNTARSSNSDKPRRRLPKFLNLSSDLFRSSKTTTTTDCSHNKKNTKASSLQKESSGRSLQPSCTETTSPQSARSLLAADQDKWHAKVVPNIESSQELLLKEGVKVDRVPNIESFQERRLRQATKIPNIESAQERRLRETGKSSRFCDSRPPPLPATSATLPRAVSTPPLPPNPLLELVIEVPKEVVDEGPPTRPPPSLAEYRQHREDGDDDDVPVRHYVLPSEQFPPLLDMIIEVPAGASSTSWGDSG
ncbi:expressed unknown protein [Seminavis robusta]|uniref:Uncharacterized protein n=1 Tax=Seminavis robusta TaxID=568900 RepID=A0A9N8H359_9STRA|nr:expressed unknown protein [Seminavis robusta]|eukprot:Sro20_g014330.1 n/a (414) ;mRNA; r:142127-143368